jgi:hypothetical protein
MKLNWSWLRKAVLVEGRTYDAVIGTCAEPGKAAPVLTFNAGAFMVLGKDFAVVIPGSV